MEAETNEELSWTLGLSLGYQEDQREEFLKKGGENVSGCLSWNKLVQSRDSQLGVISSPGDIWQYVETFLIVRLEDTTGILVSRG